MSQQNGDIPDQNRCSQVRVRLCSEIEVDANLKLTFWKSRCKTQRLAG
jgi:hypothetical protein